MAIFQICFVLIVIHCCVPQETDSATKSVNDTFIEIDVYKTFENFSARNALEEKQLKIPFVDVDCAIMDELYLYPNFVKFVDSIVNVQDSSMRALEFNTKFPASDHCKYKS